MSEPRDDAPAGNRVLLPGVRHRMPEGPGPLESRQRRRAEAWRRAEGRGCPHLEDEDDGAADWWPGRRVSWGAGILLLVVIGSAVGLMLSGGRW